jgi:pyruvate,water dikinase
MIDADSAGVLFTCDPVEKKLDRYVVSSVFGVGEKLVSGEADADTFWLNSETGAELKKELVTEKSSLSEKSLQELFHLGQKIQKQLRRPQDIEWAIKDGVAYLLQTRPVTNLDQNLIGYPNLWDNSNIVESYGGLTSPLSFSFALRNYKGVYVQFCEILGVPAEIVKDMDSYLGYMLGHLNGRVYYNLFNWYKLVGVLPGFRQNRQFMETMMGVSESLTDEIANRIAPHPSWDTFTGKFRKFVTGINFLWYHFTIQSMVEDFLTRFHKTYDYFRKLPLRQMRGDELITVYFKLEREMMGKWKAPIINDFLCMVHFGILRKLVLTWLKDLDSTIQNDLLSGEGGLESAEPTKAMMKLAYEVSKSLSLKKIFDQHAPEDIFEALNQSSEQAFFREVNSYIDKYGFRCMSEMKLEEIDLSTDPTYLFVCIKNYLKSGSVEMHDSSKEVAMRKQAEAKVFQHLPVFKRPIFRWVLKHARKAVKNRENTRFARTRAYGVGRIIFQTIGEDLANTGAINHKRDIFWLTIEEVFGIYNGTLVSPNLKDLIALRKNSFAEYAEEPDARILTRGEVYWHNSFFAPPVETVDEGADYDLKGLPCCPGVLEGVVKVVMNPTDDLSLNGEILVTARTDPGWVPLYPSISGLLVERGSLLSHSAIVAREMGIPAVVSIPGLTKKLKTGMRIRMDGKAGTIKLLE